MPQKKNKEQRTKKNKFLNGFYRRKSGGKYEDPIAIFWTLIVHMRSHKGCGHKILYVGFKRQISIPIQILFWGSNAEFNLVFFKKKKKMGGINIFH